MRSRIPLGDIQVVLFVCRRGKAVNFSQHAQVDADLEIPLPIKALICNAEKNINI